MKCPSPAWCLALTSLTGMLVTSSLPADESTNVARTMQAKVPDVSLDRDHKLHGRVVSPTGEPLAGVHLSIVRSDQVTRRQQTDSEGRFTCQLQKGGPYQIMLEDTSTTTVRVWTTAAAPPDCPRQLVVVKGEILRGQGGSIPYAQINPWVVAGVIAAAVAIPVILSNHRSDRGEGS